MDNETKDLLQKILLGQQEINQRISAVETKLDRVESLTTKTIITQENDIAFKLNLIYENQVTIIDHDKKLASYDSRA